MTMKRIGLILLAVLAVNAFGRTWFVSSGGNDENDGSCWGTALSNPQTAIDLSAVGDEIWIGAGEYIPSNVRDIKGSSLYASSFVLKSGVSIYGGFEGDEASLEERELSGDGRWDFTNRTTLRGSPSMPSSVLVGELTENTVINGLTITGGKAAGSSDEGAGGGIRITGKATVECCQIMGNEAQYGGGLYGKGEITVNGCSIYSNNLIGKGWSGNGAGLYVDGTDAIVQNCLIYSNGSNGGTKNGGGAYLTGQTDMVHCTVAGNNAERKASGVCLESQQCSLENSIIWGNAGCASQIYGNSTQLSHNAIEAYSNYDSNIPLEADNAGPNDKDFNDNWVDGYYICFEDPQNWNFNLAPGSYAINRASATSIATDAAGTNRSQNMLPDIGALESPYKGNLAIDFELEYPFVYAENSKAMPILGIASPEDIDIAFSDRDNKASWTTTASEWSATWLEACNAFPQIHATVTGNFQSAWNQVVIERNLSVATRPIAVLAEDQECTYNEPMPELTWNIIAGSLAFDDKFTGTLECTLNDVLDTNYPITQGSLQIDDGRNGANYSIFFLEGEMLYRKAQAEIEISTDDIEYTGTANGPAVTTEPQVEEYNIIYTGVNGTVYGPSDIPPTDAGDYAAELTISDPHYCGTDTTEFTIAPAILTLQPDAISRTYAMPNPDFTITASGYKRQEDEQQVVLPTPVTFAVATSVPGNYPIELTGGYARNYIFNCLEGTMTIKKASVIAVPVCSSIFYGEPLNYSIIDGTATHSENGKAVKGNFQWETGDTILDAGEHLCKWIFVPDDSVCYNLATGDISLDVAKTELISNEIMTVENLNYGNKLSQSKLTCSFISAVNGDAVDGTLAWQNGDELVPAGTIERPWVFTPEDKDSFEVTTGKAVLTVTPITLKIVPTVKSKTYGDAEPELSYTVEGLLEMDSNPISGSLKRSSGEICGTYNFDCSELESASSNYLPGDTDETFSITKRKVVIQINDLYILSSNENPQFTYTLLEGSLAFDDEITGSPSCNYLENGSFTIYKGTLALNDNYILEVRTGTLNVIEDKIVLTMTVDKEKIFGDPLSSVKIIGNAKYSISGKELEGTFEWTNPEDCAGLTGNNVKTVCFTPNNTKLSEIYASILVPITPRRIRVKARDMTEYYGVTRDELNFEYDIVEGTLVDGYSITGEMSIDPPKSILVPGIYEICQSTFDAHFVYELEFIGGTLTIVNKPITLTISNASKKIGDTDPKLTYSCEKLSFNDKISGSLYREAGENLGEYEIYTDKLVLPQFYDWTIKTGKFSITDEQEETRGDDFNSAVANQSSQTEIHLSSDSSEAQNLNAALSQLANGGTLYLEAGDYYLDEDTVAIDRQINIIGIQDDNGNAPVIHGSIFIHGQDAYNSSLRGIDLVAEAQDAAVIVCNQASVNIDDCLIKADLLAVNAESSSNLSIENSMLDAPLTGIYFKQNPGDFPTASLDTTAETFFEYP